MAQLEASVADEEEFKKALPPDWQGAEQERFLREWVALQPSLADADLRGVSYLSRDTVTLVGRRRGLSEQAAEALRTLSGIKRLPSPAANRVAADIPATERGDVMEALLAEMRRHKDWKQQPPEVNGALVLARLDARLTAALHDFLREVSGAKPPAWINVVLQGEPRKVRH